MLPKRAWGAALSKSDYVGDYCDDSCESYACIKKPSTPDSLWSHKSKYEKSSGNLPCADSRDTDWLSHPVEFNDSGNLRRG